MGVAKTATSKTVPDKRHDTENGVTKHLETNDIDFDDLLSSAGEFGRYQLLLFLSTFPFYCFGVFAFFTQLFLTEVSSNHWCWIPELENLTDIQRRNLAIPSDNSRLGYSQCKAYVANWTEVLDTGIQPDGTWDVTPCQHGWEYNKSEIPYPTISSELGWVCDRDNYQAMAQSIFSVGSIMGGFIIGWIADRFGRLPATVVSNLIGCIGGVASVFAKNFLQFVICRFVMGMAYDNIMMMVYLLVLEYVAPKYRTIMANTSFAVFYSLAVTALPWIALVCGHWKTLSLVTSVPMAIVIFAPLIIPESPRWLISRGRIDDAVNKVLFIGRINREEVPLKLIEQFKASAFRNRQQESSSIIDVLRQPLLRKTFIFMCLEYICCALVFDALVRSIGTLDFDFFISFSVISVTEFPSILLLAFIMDWAGRRWLAAISFAIGSVFSILTVFMNGGLLSVMCAVIARFTVNMAYGICMQWATEMLPTPVRGSGMSVVHMCGFIGTILSSYISYLKTFIYWLPLVIVAGISALAAILALMLPETAQRELPQTFDDAVKLIEDQKFFSMPCLNRNTLVSENVNGKVNDGLEIVEWHHK